MRVVRREIVLLLVPRVVADDDRCSALATPKEAERKRRAAATRAVFCLGIRIKAKLDARLSGQRRRRPQMKSCVRVDADGGGRFWLRVFCPPIGNTRLLASARARACSQRRRRLRPLLSS